MHAIAHFPPHVPDERVHMRQLAGDVNAVAIGLADTRKLTPYPSIPSGQTAMPNEILRI